MRTPKRLTSRNSRPVGEAGRYLSDEQYYRFYYELVVNRESVRQSALKAGINKNTGHKIAKELDGLIKGERHPRIIEIEGRTIQMPVLVPLDPTIDSRETSRLYTFLNNRVVGQEEAKRAIVDIYSLYQAGLNPFERPVGSFLFLGPTGTGKTSLCQAVAEFFAGKAGALLTVDCAEFQHSHEVAKLIGSPPGYLGHRETHPIFSQERLNEYQTESMKMSFVLFDEIEKASDAVWKILLGILDKAKLTLGDNRAVTFNNSFIFLTSNLAARDIQAAISGGMGFAGKAYQQADHKSIVNLGTKAARKHFTPEFIGRLDHTVTFKVLTVNEIEQILNFQIDNLESRIKMSSLAPWFHLVVTPAARAQLLKLGVDERYGVRELKRVIQREVEKPLARILNSGQLTKLRKKVLVDFVEEKFVFFEEREKTVVAA